MANWNSLIIQYHEHFIRVDSIADMDAVRKTGKMGVIIGMQNSVQFDTVDDVNIFYNLGQRVSQLTYNSRNYIGTGSMDRSDGGLSDFGVSVVERMNQLGMAVDVAHCGDQTTLDAFEASSKPVLVTHSNSRKLSNGHRRTKTDEALIKMAEKGGVIGLTGVRSFVRDREPTNLEHFLDHFDYIGKLIGLEFLGIGSDMDPDGYDDMSSKNMKMFREIADPKYRFRDKIDTDGFSHPERIYDLVDGLIRCGYSDENISLILGGNFKRALGEIFIA